MNEWKRWFAWYPVRLLTWEVAWLRTVVWRPTTGWVGSGRYDYANLGPDD